MDSAGPAVKLEFDGQGQQNQIPGFPATLLNFADKPLNQRTFSRLESPRGRDNQNFWTEVRSRTCHHTPQFESRMDSAGPAVKLEFDGQGQQNQIGGFFNI